MSAVRSGARLLVDGKLARAPGRHRNAGRRADGVPGRQTDANAMVRARQHCRL